MANMYKSTLESSLTPTGDAVNGDVLSGKTFMNSNGPQTGSMPNNGAVSGTATPSQPYTIPEGYHNGQGVVTASGGTIKVSTNNLASEGVPINITLSTADITEIVLFTIQNYWVRYSVNGNNLTYMEGGTGGNTYLKINSKNGATINVTQTLTGGTGIQVAYM